MTPRLRPHVQITRQHYRGRRWHVVHDPASNQFYRLNPIAHEFVSLLDGAREVEAAWKIALGKFGDSAPTQNEVIQLLSQLYSSNLLSVDETPETEQLLRRGRERLKKKIQQQAIGIMYFRIRVFNPDAMLTALEPIFRPFLNRWGLLAWAVLLISALIKVLPEYDKLADGFGSAMSPSNWPLLMVVFVVTKAFHEMGHGLICKRFGGQVPEFGLMMLVFFPAPYVDASAAWGFPSKWQRMAVGAGGMLFELTIASVCAWYWATSATSGTNDLATQLAYNAMLTASVSTVLFNANPLMRFDGYYILSDLLEVPNLMQRSTGMLKFLMQRYVYGIKRAIVPSSQRTEQAILIIYGLAAMAYRIFLFVSITLLVMGQFFAVGAVLALWTAAAWFILPVGAFIHWLAASPQLSDRRPRAILTSLALLAAGLLLTGVIPMADHRRGTGVIESAGRSGVFIGTDGFIISAHKRPGDLIRKGDPIVTMESRELEQKLEQTDAMIRELQTEERRAIKDKQPAIQRVATDRLDVFTQNRAQLEERLASLVVRAPHDGVLVGSDPDRLVGAYAKRGASLCEIVDTTNVRIAASLGQGDAAWLFDSSTGPKKVELRLVSDARGISPWHSVEGANIRENPAGRTELPHAAIGFPGGGEVETDPQDQGGIQSVRPRFTVYIDPVMMSKDGTAMPIAVGQPGERVRVRFTLPDRPLLSQWYDRFSKIIQGRVTI
ncbi:MAG: PqqD family peptide modification chaperone [Phycisphaerales bacterium]|nr:PqqD family peptide modification chaperone [Phycisphaerales bacterium]